MESIIILAHGSKRTETENILDSLVEKVKTHLSTDKVYPAFLQFSKTSIESVCERLVFQGEKEIKIVPLFLFDGIHVTQDIPEKIEELQRKYPKIKFSLMKYIGDDDKIVDIIVDRINIHHVK